MSALRFHHVFFMLMLIALISAFSLRPERSARITPQIQTLFAPISTPARALGQMMADRWQKPVLVDPRSAKAVFLENQELRVANASLAAQLDDLKKLNADRAALGDVRKQSNVYAVAGSDSGNRESLSIGGSSLEGLRLDQPAIYIGGLAGKIVQVGVAGAKVQLITDPQSAMTAALGRFETDQAGQAQFVRVPLPASAPAVLVHGAGNNTLVIDTLAMVDAQGIHVGDRVVLADNAWPASLQGYTIGEITQIIPRPGSPLFARISITPSIVLNQLKDVSVVLK